MIGILLIATRKYKQFVIPLLEQIEKYFLPGKQKCIYLFHDGGTLSSTIRLPVINYYIEPLKFPYATLYRYKLFCEQKEHLIECSHLFYLDVDMAIENIISDEILCDGLTVVYHPGFYSKKEVVGHWGSNGVVRESLAWIDTEKRFGYVAGGFNGGKSEVFLQMAKILSRNIKEDEINGVRAEHNDESHLNAYLKNVYKGNILYLTPEFCMVEQNHLRKLWGIDGIKPSIIALAKNHAEIRN